MSRSNSALLDSWKEVSSGLDEEEWVSGSTNEDNCSVDAVSETETEEKEPQKRRPYLGLVCGVLSGLCFSFASAIVKYLDNISPFELATFRFVGILLPTIPCLIVSKQDVWPKGIRLMLILRSVLGTLNLTLQFYAISHMPLADASVIIFSAPVFVAISARIFLKEPCDVISVVCIIVTMIGVLLIARPTFLFYGVISEKYTKEALWGIVAAFTGTIFLANVYIIVRILRGIHWSVILFNFSIIGTLMTSSLTLAVGDAYLPHDGTEWLMVLVLGVFSFGGQILVTFAFKFEHAGPASIARSSDVVFVFIWQIVFFHEVPTVWSIAGALLVTSSVLLTAIRKWMTSLPEMSSVRNRM